MKKFTMREMLELLNDQTLDISGRDDLITHISDYGDESALSVLYSLASNPKSEDDLYLLDQFGEAIGRIMCRTGTFKLNYIEGLVPYKDGSALHAAIRVIQLCRPDWYDKYNLESLKKTPLIKNIPLK